MIFVSEKLIETLTDIIDAAPKDQFTVAINIVPILMKSRPDEFTNDVPLISYMPSEFKEFYITIRYAETNNYYLLDCKTGMHGVLPRTNREVMKYHVVVFGNDDEGYILHQGNTRSDENFVIIYVQSNFGRRILRIEG